MYYSAGTYESFAHPEKPKDVGSCDGRKDVTKGFFMRGGREMDNHFEVMWDSDRQGCSE